MNDEEYRGPAILTFGEGRDGHTAADEAAGNEAPEHDTPESEAVTEHHAVEGHAIKNRAVENRAVENRAVESHAVENRAVENRAVESRAVEIRMWARFEPVEGRFRWAGRTAPDAVLLERTAAGLRDARLSIGDYRAVDVRLSEPDPWGGVRLTGVGTPPWFS